MNLEMQFLFVCIVFCKLYQFFHHFCHFSAVPFVFSGYSVHIIMSLKKQQLPFISLSWGNWICTRRRIERDPYPILYLNIN